jgi:hypothetical protein
MSAENFLPMVAATVGLMGAANAAAGASDRSVGGQLPISMLSAGLPPMPDTPPGQAPSPSEQKGHQKGKRGGNKAATNNKAQANAQQLQAQAKSMYILLSSSIVSSAAFCSILIVVASTAD